MKYIKLFEHTYSVYDMITMPEYQAKELLFTEITGINPDVQFINDLLEYSKFYVNWQNSLGITALIVASDIGNKEIVKLLLERPEIDVNLQDVDGETALMIASRMGRTEIARMLLERPEIDVNLQDEDGYTALMWASEEVHTEIANLIKDHLNSKKTL